MIVKFYNILGKLNNFLLSRQDIWNNWHYHRKCTSQCNQEFCSEKPCSPRFFLLETQTVINNVDKHPLRPPKVLRKNIIIVADECYFSITWKMINYNFVSYCFYFALLHSRVTCINFINVRTFYFSFVTIFYCIFKTCPVI